MNRVETLVSLLYNMAQNKSNSPAFDKRDTNDSLLPFTHCPHLLISLLAKSILCFLRDLVDDDSLSELQLTVKEADFLVNSVTESLDSKEMQSSGFKLTELLENIISFSSIDGNLEKFSRDLLLDAVFCLTMKGEGRVQTLAIHLLWRFMRETSTKDVIPSHLSGALSTTLSTLENSGDVCAELQCLSHSILHLQGEPGELLTHFVFGIYYYSMYALKIICSWFIQRSTCA